MKQPIFLLITLLLTVSIESYDRTNQKKVTAHPRYKTQKKSQQIIYVPVPVTPEQYHAMQQTSLPKDEAHKEPNVFPHIVSIVGNVGKILLDRHNPNKEKLVDNFAHLIGNICNFVHDVTTKGPLSDERTFALAESVADRWLTLYS